MILPYVWFALFAMLFYGVVDFTYGHATRQGVTPAAGIWVWMEGTYAWTPPVFLGIAAGVFAFIGLWSFMKSLQIGETSVSTPIYRNSFVITALTPIIFSASR